MSTIRRAVKSHHSVLAAPRWLSDNRGMTDHPAIILAGGRATRMGGGDKPLKQLGSGTILQQIITRLRPQCGDLAINANGDPARFAAFDLPVVADSLPDYPGPLAGILAGIEWAAARDVKFIVTVAGDTPFFPADLAQKFAEHSAGRHPVIAASQPAAGDPIWHPVFGLWPTDLAADLRAYLLSGQRRLRGFAQRHGARVVVWDGREFDPFFNINAPEDLIRAQQHLDKSA